MQIVLAAIYIHEYKFPTASMLVSYLITGDTTLCVHNVRTRVVAQVSEV